MASSRNVFVAATMGLVFVVAAGCPSRSSRTQGGKVVIRVEGSDTMVNLAQAWAETYNKLHPEVSVQVSGGGSGVGIASLIKGVVDMANASRSMHEKEIKLAEANTGKRPQEFTIALDALAVYVHKDNPIESISLQELAEIYGEGGAITTWSKLGVKNTACTSDEITRVGRQNNSGTYQYFREVVVGEKRDFKLGSIDQSGSKDVVALLSRTPCGIGYSGMGYLEPGVKWLKISAKKGETGVEPSVETARDGTYPLARPLYIYTLGEPTGELKEYLDWIRSEAGQQVVRDLGYVPVERVSGDDPPAGTGETPGTAPKGALGGEAAASEPQVKE